MMCFQRCSSAGSKANQNNMGLQMQTSVEIFTGSEMLGQLVVMALLAYRTETRTNSVESTVKELTKVVQDLVTRVEKLEKNTIKKFW
jgi:hypothetical protein